VLATSSASVDILDAVSRYEGSTRRGFTVFSARAGGDDGRGRTPALARVALQVARRFAALSLALQQTAVHPAAVAGVLCLMRYETAPFRSRSTPARAPRVARRMPLQAVPDYTTLYRFLRRLEDDDVDRGLQETVRRCGAPAPSRFCRHRRHGALPHFRQHLLPPPSGEHAHGAQLVVLG